MSKTLFLEILKIKKFRSTEVKLSMKPNVNKRIWHISNVIPLTGSDLGGPSDLIGPSCFGLAPEDLPPGKYFSKPFGTFCHSRCQSCSRLMKCWVFDKLPNML